MATLPKPDRDAAARLLDERDAHPPQCASVGEVLGSIEFAPPPPSNPRDLGTQSKQCDVHGPYLSRGQLVYRYGNPEVWTPCPGCEAEERRAQAEAEAAAERQRQRERMAAMIGAADIPARFRERTFDTFIAATDKQRRALTVARDFAESFDPRSGAGLIFAGLPGTGKSHLAASIMLSLIGRHSVQYVTCMGMIRMVRDTWRRESPATERDVLRALGHDVDLLVIDEVGVQYGTEGEQTILFDVLDTRYGAMRPTILLTNQDRAGFTAYVGERVYDRLRETSRWVPFDWESHRAKSRAA